MEHERKPVAPDMETREPRGNKVVGRQGRTEARARVCSNKSEAQPGLVVNRGQIAREVDTERVVP